jgi:hypothetical protein
MMGASIGRAGGTGSRTAGGLLQLDWNGQILVLITTNRHILTNTEVEQGILKQGTPKEQPFLTVFCLRASSAFFLFAAGEFTTVAAASRFALLFRAFFLHPEEVSCARP